jgi:hypothetical protein
MKEKQKYFFEKFEYLFFLLFIFLNCFLIFLNKNYILAMKNEASSSLAQQPIIESFPIRSNSLREDKRSHLNNILFPNNNLCEDLADFRICLKNISSLSELREKYSDLQIDYHLSIKLLLYLHHSLGVNLSPTTIFCKLEPSKIFQINLLELIKKNENEEFEIQNNFGIKIYHFTYDTIQSKETSDDYNASINDPRNLLQILLNIEKINKEGKHLYIYLKFKTYSFVENSTLAFFIGFNLNHSIQLIRR